MSRAELNEPIPSRYVVGIDLGTTNSAVCYIDTHEEPWQVRVLSIPQWVAHGQLESRETLPSFHFQPRELGGPSQTPRLPWETKSANYVVGVMAREEGRLSPDRLIVSAKSWLCHHGVDRTADLLPWQGAEDVERLSPIEVSARYLRHVRAAWDTQFPDAPLADQDIVLTLPASFDEVARELTIQAAAAAQLPRVVLIEEPQAAFYAWVDRHRDNWQQQVSSGQKILVCDIGGGTSDFTLIRVRDAQQDSSQANSPESSDTAAGEVAAAQRLVQFHRIAVGEHLILGGDNFDLALARKIEQQLAEATKLDARQWDVLVRTCRQVKETLLGGDAPESLTINLPGSGSRLIGGGLQAEVTRAETNEALIEGFFPNVDLDSRPQARQSGFQEFGLPYATDAAITRHLAAFLTSHRYADADPEQVSVPAHTGPDPARPDLILFNGGVFASPQIRQRLIQVIEGWFRHEHDPSWTPTILENDRLDLAVAHGAAYYGMVRRGEGVRIAAGLARSYYVEVAHAQADQPATALCVVPGSAQPGETIDLPDMQFDLLISEPVEFPLYASSTRLTDRPGQTVTVDLEQMRMLPPLRTALKTQRRNQRGTVPVQLQAHLSEIGTIELACIQIDADRRWRLQFDVRTALETDRVAEESTGEQQGVLDESVWERCHDVLQQAFGSSADLAPNRLMKALQAAAELEKSNWPMSFLRRLWEALMSLQEGRRLSASHEARWLNLLGYSLRPGYGVAVDDWRVAETWRHVQGKLAHNQPICRNEAWILWRRISGGLPAGQQRAVAEPLLAAVRALHRRMTGGGVKGESHFTIPEFSEIWRLLGSLELLTIRDKLHLGEMLIDLLPKRKMEGVQSAMFWTLGRLGNRQPLYGPLNTVLEPRSVSKWIDAILAVKGSSGSQAFALMQLSRKTGDRYRDVDTHVTERVTEWLEVAPEHQHLVQLVREGGTLDESEQQQAFGESLPKGLVLRSPTKS